MKDVVPERIAKGPNRGGRAARGHRLARLLAPVAWMTVFCAAFEARSDPGASAPSLPSAPSPPSAPSRPTPGALPAAPIGSIEPDSLVGDDAIEGDAEQGPTRPWAQNVSPDRKKRARARLREGNLLVKESLFRQAVTKYGEALAEWNHPGIHYNLALAFLGLDQPLQVREHLEAALRYGAAALDPDKFETATRDLALVERQLAKVEIRSESAGARIMLDGKEVFMAPGKYEGFVAPGPHSVSASKPGYMITQRTKVLHAGEVRLISLRPYAEGELFEHRRPWPSWQPVAVVATVTGAALLLGGVGLTLASKDSLQRYDDQVHARCSVPSGCPADSDLHNLRRRGERFQTAATVAYAAGGTALVGGILLLVLNRAVPHPLVHDDDSTQPSITPMIEPHAAGAVGTLRF